MTGPEHYREAERLLADAARGADTGPVYFLDDAAPTLAAAQVHATLALAAAVVDGPAVMRPEDRDEWDGVFR